MRCIRFFGPIERRVSVTSVTEIFVPFTGWMPAQGVDKVRATLRLLAESGLIRARLADQTAIAAAAAAGLATMGRPSPSRIWTSSIPSK